MWQSHWIEDYIFIYNQGDRGHAATCFNSKWKTNKHLDIKRCAEKKIEVNTPSFKWLVQNGRRTKTFFFISLFCGNWLSFSLFFYLDASCILFSSLSSMPSFQTPAHPCQCHSSSNSFKKPSPSYQPNETLPLLCSQCYILTCLLQHIYSVPCVEMIYVQYVSVSTTKILTPQRVGTVGFPFFLSTAQGTVLCLYGMPE